MEFKVHGSLLPNSYSNIGLYFTKKPSSHSTNHSLMISSKVFGFGTRTKSFSQRSEHLWTFTLIVSTISLVAENVGLVKSTGTIKRLHFIDSFPRRKCSLHLSKPIFPNSYSDSVSKFNSVKLCHYFSSRMYRRSNKEFKKRSRCWKNSVIGGTVFSRN